MATFLCSLVLRPLNSVVEFPIKFHNRGLVNHGHGIRKFGTMRANSSVQCAINPVEPLVYMDRIVDKRDVMNTSTDGDSYYMRSLPCPPAIDGASDEGHQLRLESYNAGTAAGCYQLLLHVNTQKELTFCGLASLSAVLNSLRVDPKRIWKGPWRWYDDYMVVDPEMNKKIKLHGITFKELADLGCRNGLEVEVFQAKESSIEEFTKQVIKATSSKTSYIIASYSRPILKQTGDGHFSPLAAYHVARNMVLIMDVAQYKYPSHWIPCNLLWKAMNTFDEETGETRGYMVLKKQAI